MLPFFLQGVTLGFSASVTPGPFLAFLLSQTLKYGWRSTLPAAFAPLISDGPIIAVMLLLLNQLPSHFLAGIQLLGGLFLIYLAYGAWQIQPPALDEVAVTTTTRQTFFKGVLMNALSPGPYIFWGIIAGPIVIEGWQQAPLFGLSFMLGFYLLLIGGFLSFIAFFATASRIDFRINHILSRISAVALLLFGVYQIVSVF